MVEVAQFVSRGGLKLDAALNHFAQVGDAVAVASARVLDAGASTGGFVDCLLQRGAGQVVACDVGRGLLHPKIAADQRVEVRDELNARDIAAARGGEWTHGQVQRILNRYADLRSATLSADGSSGS